MTETFYIVYKTTNLINNKYYVGVHKTTDLNDSYLGSGTYLNRSIKKHGRNNFKRENLFIFDNEDDMFAKEVEIVNADFILNKETYNVALGGKTSYNTGLTTVYDEEGNYMSIRIDDPDYVSGKYVNIGKGKSHYVDNDGNKYHVSVTDPRVISGELISINKGKVLVQHEGKRFSVDINNAKYLDGTYKHINTDRIICTNVNDESGKVRWVDRNDPRFETVELVSVNKGKLLVTDGTRVFSVSNKDPKYLDGTFKSIFTGIVNVTKNETGKKVWISTDEYKENKDKYTHMNQGNIPVYDENGVGVRISKDDPRWKNGTYKSVFKGMVNVYNEDGEIIKVSTNDPKYLDGTYKFVHDGKTVYYDENGKTVHVYTDDPKVKDGTYTSIKKGKKCVQDKDGNYMEVDVDHDMTGLKNVNKDTIWMHHLGKEDLIRAKNEKEAKKREKEGYIRGFFSFHEYINVHNLKVKKNRQIKSTELEDFLKDNPDWKLGYKEFRDKKNRVWVNNGKNNRNFHISEIEEFLKNNPDYKSGMMKKKKDIAKTWVHDPNDDNKNKLVPVKDLESYYAKGFLKGMSKMDYSETWVHDPNTKKSIKVLKADLEDYLNKGYVKNKYNPNVKVIDPLGEKIEINENKLKEFLSKGYKLV